MCPDATTPEGAVRIPLRARDGSIRAYTLVDAADAEWVNRDTWRLYDGYAQRGMKIEGRIQHFRLHREILGLTPGDGLEGDHINRNRLDNRRVNLRVVSKPENNQNRPGWMHRLAYKSSPFRGVIWDKARNKWRAQIRVSGKLVRLGRYDLEADAAEAARSARRRLMPYAVD